MVGLCRAVLLRAESLAYDPYACRSQHEQYARHEEHAYGKRSAVVGSGEAMEYHAAAKCCHNLRHGDGTVEEPKICADISARECVCQDGEWHCEHSSPSTAHHRVADPKHILIVYKED